MCLILLVNITVYYVLFQCLYSNKILLESIHSIKQFIDDGAGIFKGSSRQFETWKQSFKQLVSAYKLYIDGLDNILKTVI